MAAVILFGNKERLNDLKNEVMRKVDCSFAVYDDADAAVKDIQERRALALVVIDSATDAQAASAVKQAAEAKDAPVMTIDATNVAKRQSVIQLLRGEA